MLSCPGGFVVTALLDVAGRVNVSRDDSGSDDEFAPQSISSARREDRKRKRRVREWLAAPSTLDTLVVLVCVAKPVIELLYYLFKNGSINPNGAPAMFRCCQLATSRVVRMFTKLANGFDKRRVGHGTWDLAVALWGDMSTWPKERLKCCTISASIVMGNLWRRFVVRLRTWTWRLCLTIPDICPHHARVAVIQEFLDASECCLDDIFGKRFRALVSRAEDFDLEPIIDFLKAALGYALATSTHAECSFARLRRWLNQMAGKSSTAATVAAHHVLSESKRVHRMPGLRSGLRRGRGSKKKVGSRRAVWGLSKR